MIPDIIKNNKDRLRLWNFYFDKIFENQEFKTSDIPVFQTFITLLHQQEEAQERIDADGMYYDSTDKDGKLLVKVNPAHRVYADTNRMLIPYFMRYGLSEYDRKNIKKKFSETDVEVVSDDFTDIE